MVYSLIINGKLDSKVFKTKDGIIRALYTIDQTKVFSVTFVEV